MKRGSLGVAVGNPDPFTANPKDPSFGIEIVVI
jgi:hypothetical protein